MYVCGGPMDCPIPSSANYSCMLPGGRRGRRPPSGRSWPRAGARLGRQSHAYYNNHRTGIRTSGTLGSRSHALDGLVKVCSFCWLKPFAVSFLTSLVMVICSVLWITHAACCASAHATLKWFFCSWVFRASYLA